MGRARLSLYAVAVLASLAGATAACVLLGELLQRGGHPLGARLVGLLPVPLALAAGVALTR
ncbi:MAG TPA: hypothetical protein VH880_07955, partial [Anaeromyxobacteraceae bacterium]